MSAKEIVNCAYKDYGEEKAVEALVRMYSPYCDGNNDEKWSEIKSEMRMRGVPIDIDRTSMRMRNYRVIIREFTTSGAELNREVNVLALCKRHAHERAAEQFAMENESLDPKRWYISYERTICND